MGWIIGILVGIIILWSVIKIMSDEKGASTSTQSHPVATAPAWREPVTPDEHFVLLSIMADALSAFGMGVHPSGLSEVNMAVTYRFAPNEPDRVTMTLYGINSTSIFKNSRAWQYLRNHSQQDGFYVELKFEFPSGQGGAPFYYRDEEDVINFVRQFAPTVYSCPRRKTNDDAWLCFRKEGVRRRAENLDAEIVNAYSTYRKY